MHHRHLFGLIIRTVSLSAIVYGVWNLIAAAQQMIALVLGRIGGGNGSAPWLSIYAFYGIAFITCGSLALSFAEVFVRWAYRKEIKREAAIPPAIPVSHDDLLA